MTHHETADEKYALLQENLRTYQRAVVAFSGGVDSTFLLHIALKTLGTENVLALIGDSESYPAREMAEAEQLAKDLGATAQVIRTDELQDADYAANPKNRCYFCKKHLYGDMQRIAQQEGYAVVLDGNNADDTGDWRPGQQAAREMGVRSPLMDVGFTKAEIRALSKAFNLPTWNKPALACLSSRIPYDTPITREALSTIDQAEEFLRDQGFTQVRVRHHDDIARIEVTPEEMAKCLQGTLRAEITERLRTLGYRYVTLDLTGYRTGSMNETFRAATV